MSKPGVHIEHHWRLTYSAKLTVAFKPETYVQLNEFATYEGYSMSRKIRAAVREWFARRHRPGAGLNLD
jgi:hypothetical protein